MYKLQLVLEYDGSGFYGFQTQRDRARPSVQGELERVLAHVVGEPVTVEGSGRTDRGVHALEQVVSFFVCRDEIPPEGVVRKLQVGLPDAIRVKKWKVVPDSFHPRHGVARKAYSYLLVYDRRTRTFQRHYVWNVPHKLDVERMREGAAVFVGTHDFTAFANGGREPVDRVRTVYRCRLFHVPRQANTLVVRVTGNGFLHRMVRRIVGALVDVGRGRLAAPDLARMLAERRSDAASYTIAPACGLYMSGVRYLEEYDTGSETE